MLLPWGDAALIALVLAVASRGARRWPSRAARVAGPLAWETAIVLALYACWMKGADWAVTSAGGATGHGLWVWHVERDLHLPSELSVQRLFLPHPLWAQAANGFYAVVHVPALIVFLLWMYFRHPTQYAKWRNVGAVLTGACLLIQMVPVAPPRLIPQLGFVDTALRYGQSVYGTGGIKIAPQLAAMPSVHVGWAVFIAVAVILVSPSRWRWLVLAHPALTALAVVATANHWWLDGIVAGALLPIAMGVEAGVAAGWARRRPPRPAEAVVTAAG
ncbi:MAG TPA: phosphatase PAP2 family protein [Acidimicrobiales bacterium]|nr:phosphatase PAP2 family protein [Acidimicrobiales bacterium]